MARELEKLKTAILNEVQGQRFYASAAEQAQNPEVKQAFLQLAADEQKHETWLRTLYDDIKQKQEGRVYNTDDYFRLPGIFSKKNVPAADDLEITVYRIGILLEEASANFYREAAEGETPEVAALLNKLATWEDGHKNALQQRYDELQAEWLRKEGLAD